jgi:excisionase family DNA binding protein
MNDMPITRKRINSKDAAEYLGVTPRELKEIRRQRRIAFYRIGHRTMSFAVADLDAFLLKCRVAPAGEAIGAWRR